MANSQPLVSIIVPCYNCANWIEDAVNSCLRQTYRNIEIILINDGSEDNTLDLIKKFNNENPGIIRYATFDDNKGQCEAVNFGIDISKGDYFLFFESDDVLMDDAVETLLKTILDKNVKIAVGDYINFFQNFDNRKYRSTKFFFPQDPLASLIRNMLHPCATLIIRNPRRWKRDFEPNYPNTYFYPLLVDFPVAHAGKAVAYIRQEHNPNRNTLKYDHFNPLVRLALFTDFKDFLIQKGLLTFLRAAAIEQSILANIYTAKRKNLKDYEKYFRYLNRKNFKRYYWFKPFGLSGFMYMLGLERGMSIFYNINKILNRV